ncbi:hypothetical protein C9374_012929 [Naegleria lovaniensis]|uniref:RGS domain-containing protein n=1 Tax=Naegleria lovaniensis TaxID=51637 RepID=A0AA88GAC8_NAELO|nr:uncharacterized protein C9374_012929 [Naegleria lovaniensis]KAG2372986.1 hypothetical protein C9374_012929 [Naegleria lovaniensis]
MTTIQTSFSSHSYTISCLLLVPCFLFLLLLSSQTHSQCLEEISWNKIQNGQRVIGVSSFHTLFLWKSVATQSLEMNLDTSSSDENLDQLRSNFFQHVNRSSLVIGVEKDYPLVLTQLLNFYGLSVQQQISVKKVWLTDELCRKGNVFEDVDGLFMEPFRFYYFMRMYREHSGKRKTLNEFIHPSDFVPIPLMPANLTLVKNVCQHIEWYSERLVNRPLRELSQNYSCSNHPEIQNAQMLRVLTGFLNFTNQEIRALEFVRNLTLSIDHGVYDKLEPQILNAFRSYNFTIPIQLSQVMNQFLNSTCHYCTATLCPERHFTETELYLIGEIGIISLYLFAFLVTGCFKSIIFKQRLLTPYLPIVAIIIILFYSKYLASYCFAAFHFVSLTLTLIFISIFAMTVLRIVYMRNLYQIVKNSKNIKMHKLMASLPVGLVWTGLLPALVSVLISMYAISLFVIEPYQVDVLRNIVLVAMLLGGCLLGMGAVLFDMIMNRKNIQRHGFLKFLFFDDPFHVRFDLMSLLFLFMVGILAVLGALLDNFPLSGRPLNLLVAFGASMSCGGNAIIIEMVKKLLFRKEAMVEKNGLDGLLRDNSDFYNLFREYSEKEFALEQILFWDLLKQLSSNFTELKSRIPVNAWSEMKRDFFEPYSKYELNLPSNVKKQLLTLDTTVGHVELENSNHSIQQQLSRGSTSNLLSPFRDSTSTPSTPQTPTLNSMTSQITVKQVVDIMYSELLMNMNDTFMRLQKTREFKRWKEIYDLQHAEGSKE